MTKMKKNVFMGAVTAVFSVFAGMALYTPVSVIGGCAHPGQVTLRAGQCLLDNGVLGEVLAALAKPDYLKQVGLVALNRAGDLIDCALTAIAAQPSGETSEVRALAAPPEQDNLARRAREVLESRRSAK
jgi:hypothetical protein